MLQKFFASLTLILWPIIPIYWIIVHGLTNIVQRNKSTLYFLSMTIYIIIALLFYINMDFLLTKKYFLPAYLNYIGYFILTFGIITHLWTLKLLTFYGITGTPEILKDKNFKLVTKFPFSIVRHPTYLAHSLIFFGIFLSSGYLSIFLLTIIDFIIVITIIIPLEEKELKKRFGEEYNNYKNRVKWKIIPFII